MTVKKPPPLLQVEIGWRKETSEFAARCRSRYYDQTGRGPATGHRVKVTGTW